MSDAKNLREILGIMRDFNVKRCTIGGIEVELHDSAFARAETKASPAELKSLSDALAEPEESCVCGHPILSEHSSDGCLHGCPVAVCETKTGAKPKE